MACGIEMQAHFAGDMNGLFRDFTADKGINAKLCGLLNKALSTAGAPCYAAALVPPALRPVWNASAKQHFYPLAQCLSGHRHFQLTVRHQRHHFTLYLNAEHFCQLGVITQLRMRVEWQMVTI